MSRFNWTFFLFFMIAAGLGYGQVGSVGNDSADNRSELVNTLLAMSPENRRAYLKNLDPSERKGLWFQVVKEKASRKGLTPQFDRYKTTAANKKITSNLKKKEHKRAIGTITYDNNVSTTSFGGGAIIGNRFDTHTGIPVFANGSVNTVQAVVLPGPAVTTSSAGFVLLGPQTTMGGALAIFSTFTNGLTGTVETVSFTGLGQAYTGSSFHVLFGDFANSYVPAFGTGTNMGQGHHGVVGYTGGMGPNVTGFFDFGGMFNGLVRATGNIVPVELMNFEVK